MATSGLYRVGRGGAKLNYVARELVSATPRGCAIEEEVDMPESVYRVTDVIGVSTESWEGGRSECRPDGGCHRP